MVRLPSRLSLKIIMMRQIFPRLFIRLKSSSAGSHSPPSSHSRPLLSLDIPAFFPPSAPSSNDATPISSLPQRSAKTINVQLPPLYYHEARTEYVKTSDWLPQEDLLLRDLMNTSDFDVKTRNWNRISRVHFPHRSPRDVRSRYQTIFKIPSKMDHKDREWRAMGSRMRAGENVLHVKGRWCSVPFGASTPQPSEYISNSAAVHHLDPFGAAETSGTHYRGHVFSVGEVGPSSLDLAVEQLRDVEITRVHGLTSNRTAKRSRQIRKDQGMIIMEDVRWLPEEDLVLMVAVDELGESWTSVARYLKCRKRTAAECKQRMQQLFPSDTTADTFDLPVVVDSPVSLSEASIAVSASK